MSPADLATTLSMKPPEQLSEDEARVCQMCTNHRCSTTFDRTCAIRNGQAFGSKASAEERWSCLCSCCKTQCGLKGSCNGGLEKELPPFVHAQTRTDAPTGGGDSAGFAHQALDMLH